jgi:hypothetical protein
MTLAQMILVQMTLGQNDIRPNDIRPTDFFTNIHFPFLIVGRGCLPVPRRLQELADEKRQTQSNHHR